MFIRQTFGEFHSRKSKMFQDKICTRTHSFLNFLHFWVILTFHFWSQMRDFYVIWFGVVVFFLHQFHFLTQP